jgi:anti-anti-sigma factor
MSNFSIEVRTEADGSVVVHPTGDLDGECAVEFRQVLVHVVRRMRPLRLVVDLRGVTAVDPINLGTLAALCDLADDHRVLVFLDGPSAELAAELRAAGVPPLRFRQPRDTTMVATPAVASMS